MTNLGSSPLYQRYRRSGQHAPVQQPVTQGPNGNWTRDYGQPLDPALATYQVGAQRNLDLATGQVPYEQGVLDQTYGYGAGGAANPYSRAALLQENYKRSVAGTTNSYAGSGQLYSGAYGRAQGENQRRYSIASDANRRQYDQASHGLGASVGQAAATYGTGLSNADYEALLRALGLGGSSG